MLCARMKSGKTMIEKAGKLDQRSDYPAIRSGCPANLIAITLFKLDVETIIFFFGLDVTSVYLSVNCIVIQKILL